MHKCGANPLYLASIAIGSFLMGGAVGLWLSKDEEDILEENCIKIEDLEDIGYISTDGIIPEPIRGRIEDEEYRQLQINSYSRMAKELYPDGYMDNKNLDYSEIVEDEEEETDDEEFDVLYADQIKYTGRVYTNGEPEVVVIDDDGNERSLYGEENVLYDEEGNEAVVDDGDISVDDVKNDPNVDPRVISLDEYQMGTEYVGETLIYYEEDDTLATERDEVIYNVKGVVGPDALNRFGDMSGDKDTVIVRNERLKIDYEIRKEEGSYKELVLGIELDDETALKNAKKAFNKKMAEENIER